MKRAQDLLGAAMPPRPQSRRTPYRSQSPLSFSSFLGSARGPAIDPPRGLQTQHRPPWLCPLVVCPVLLLPEPLLILTIDILSPKPSVPCQPRPLFLCCTSRGGRPPPPRTH